jgi:hypothetical protein
MEVVKLDRIVSGYVEKIGRLEIELSRLEKNSMNASPQKPLAPPFPQELLSLSQENKTLN